MLKCVRRILPHGVDAMHSLRKAKVRSALMSSRQKTINTSQFGNSIGETPTQPKKLVLWERRSPKRNHFCMRITSDDVGAKQAPFRARSSFMCCYPRKTAEIRTTSSGASTDRSMFADSTSTTSTPLNFVFAQVRIECAAPHLACSSDMHTYALLSRHRRVRCLCRRAYSCPRTARACRLRSY